MNEEAAILAIDPGREKCGLAVLTSRRVLERRVVGPEEVTAVIGEWIGRHRIRTVVVGNRTGAARIRDAVARTFPRLILRGVDEAGTTLEARRLYFADHPPTGWRRLLPLSLQVPPEPYDDYAAVALGRRFLARYGPG
ncbi:MAG: pre-16S rRNA-processing nuclease YqgF [Armatimonadota bacterium]|nr:pre-16S rRNA-processing nuclease YqgF [Armatimonadota bacterium]MDR7452044.1 pre-16S rRNA-processing nuclease YqgF [Armatimonadota bacterium]MDR7466506.1 pre-16S rRNA-processing nuclease YqgF [Armatimonadota bacterium]MDR7493228.1 pre-16S rRNA-processing nuclease YqgF [Armatimonadota bacterium]MDR7499419.1 pre-16S rRNA-processing nuclease YqgF [Armatimonadota bacterium]